MGVKVTLNTIVMAREALDRLMSLKMGAKAAYRFQKIARKIAAEQDDFEKVRISLVEKYQEEGGNSVAEEHIPAFMEEINSILAEEVDLNIQPIPIDLMEGVEASVQDIMLLSFIFEDVEE